MELARLDLRQLPGRERNLSWQVNQEMHALVTGQAKDGGSLLRINGQLYHASSKNRLEQGSSMIVKVVSLTPQLELEIVEQLRAPNASQQNPSTVVSGQLLEQAQRLKQSTLNRLVQTPYQKSQSELQALPGDSMILLNKLKRSLLKPDDLGRLERLKAALDNSGVFLESKLHSAGSEDGEEWFSNDLKALLLRLVNSLGGGGGLRYKQAAGMEPYGLSLYRELYHQPTGLKKQVIKQAEEVLQKLVDNQYRSIDETDENWQRWVFELPLYNSKEPQAIPLIIHGERDDHEEALPERRWGAEFSLNLDNCGRVRARIRMLGQSVRIELQAEDEYVAQQLHLGQDRLARKLGSGGLSLDNFNSSRF